MRSRLSQFEKFYMCVPEGDNLLQTYCFLDSLPAILRYKYADKGPLGIYLWEDQGRAPPRDMGAIAPEVLSWQYNCTLP